MEFLAIQAMGPVRSRVSSGGRGASDREALTAGPLRRPDLPAPRRSEAVRRALEGAGDPHRKSFDVIAQRSPEDVWRLGGHGHRSRAVVIGGGRNRREAPAEGGFRSQEIHIGLRIEAGIIHAEHNPAQEIIHPPQVGLQFHLIAIDLRFGQVGIGGQAVAGVIRPSHLCCRFIIHQLLGARNEDVVDVLVKPADGEQSPFLAEKGEGEVVSRGDGMAQVGIPRGDPVAGVVDLCIGDQVVVVGPGDGFGIGSPHVEPVDGLEFQVQVREKFPVALVGGGIFDDPVLSVGAVGL